MDSMETMVIKMAIGFALKQLASFGASTNWQTVKLQGFDQIKKMVPYAIVDAVLDDLVSKAVDAIATVCQDTNDLQTLCDLIVAGKIQEAITFVEDALRKLVDPSGVPASITHAKVCAAIHA